MSCGTRFSWLLSDQNEGLRVGWSWPVTLQRGAPLGIWGLPPCHKRVVSETNLRTLPPLSRKTNLNPGGEASYREGLRQVWQPCFSLRSALKPEPNEGRFKAAARLQWNRAPAEHQPDSGPKRVVWGGCTATRRAHGSGLVKPNLEGPRRALRTLPHPLTLNPKP